MTTQNLWCELPLQPIIQKVIAEEFKFKYLMPVQKAAIPHFIKNYDVAVEAQTGSGKTLTFLVPLFNTFQKMNFQQNQLFALVLSPARELAQQIFEVAQKFGIIKNAKIAVVIGGYSNEHDLHCINEKGCNFLIATPGKLRSLLEDPNLQLNIKTLEYLILDEADRLMSNEYSEDLKAILDKLPKQRRTGLFSATLSSAKMHDLMKFGLRNPVQIKVNVNDAIMPIKLKNSYHIFQNRTEKMAGLVDLIENKCSQQKSIIFFNTCASVVYYNIIFKLLFPNLTLLCMNGQMPQKKRQKILSNFKSQNQVILFTTDVLARGIDFDDVPLIIQFDPPQDPSFFIHRSGRTARQGRDGEALLLLEHHERGFIPFLQRQKIDLQEFQFQINCQFENLKEKVLTLIIQDRDIIEKGKSAFISYIRSYKEHKLQILFQFSQLNIGNVAQSFFLLRLPRIKEILGRKIDFIQSQIDPNSIPFADKNQEKQFLQKKEAKQEKLQQKELQKKQFVQKNVTKNVKNIKSIRKKVKQQNQEEEDEEIKEEQRLVKKLKTGKITLQQFKDQMKQLDPEDLQDAEYDESDI